MLDKKKNSDRQSVMPQACKWVYSAEARKISYRIVTVYFFIRAFLATWLSNNFCLSVCIIMVRTSCRISAQYSIFAVYVAQSTCALQIWIMYVHRQTCEREGEDHTAMLPRQQNNRTVCKHTFASIYVTFRTWAANMCKLCSMLTRLLTMFF